MQSYSNTKQNSDAVKCQLKIVLINLFIMLLQPFIDSQYPNDNRFYQDNDPKHVSKSTVQFMKENNINHWRSPPESPDLNPIENL